ncbi:MAG: nucleotide exchange factor GrpE [Gammaproteobacteria bacterium]|nr:nucleotide exchange factor GrpE [Gammaproteobacteria bacterium]
MASEAKASGDAQTEEETAKPPEGGLAAADTREDGAEDETPATVDDQTEDVESLRGAIEEAQREIASLEDRALRAAAEAENVRRRADRSIENARKYALERFVEDLLPAVDSFERAVEAASGHAKGEGSEATAEASAIAEGIELSLKLLLGAMERQGIAVVDPIGAPFDPNLHEAMTMVDNAEVEPGSVVDVFQKGYTVNGRLIRPARVIVARQPEVSEPVEPASDEPEADAT